MMVGQGNTAPTNQEGLICQGQFRSAVSEALALRNAFQAKSAEIKRLQNTCCSAVADDCCQVAFWCCENYIACINCDFVLNVCACLDGFTPCICVT